MEGQPEVNPALEASAIHDAVAPLDEPDAKAPEVQDLGTQELVSNPTIGPAAANLRMRLIAGIAEGNPEMSLVEASNSVSVSAATSIEIVALIEALAVKLGA